MANNTKIDLGFIVFMTAIFVGLFSLIAGVCTLAFQIVLWLKNGFWTSALVGYFLPTAHHFSWKGAEALWNAFLDFEVSSALSLVGCITIFLTLCTFAIGSTIANSTHVRSKT